MKLLSSSHPLLETKGTTALDANPPNVALLLVCKQIFTETIAAACETTKKYFVASLKFTLVANSRVRPAS
jgi:hypothetical protein